MSGPGSTVALSGAWTVPSFNRGRERPPKPRKKVPVRPAGTRTKRSTTLQKTTEPQAPTTSGAPRYHLCNSLQPRYKCGTCGLRDCVYICDKYGVHVEPGGLYSPALHWWLLVTASHVEAMVKPSHLLSCLESLRTFTHVELILCFHNADWYRGKVNFT